MQIVDTETNLLSQLFMHRASN